MRALAVVGDSEHLAVVRERLDDEDDAVRRNAARALSAMEQRLDL
jgi:HEAT repeat protein